MVSSASALQANTTSIRTGGATVGFVPTMGALHDAHLALMREARLRADVVVASIFVNPLQFASAKSAQAYPRSFARDVDACRSVGVDVIFAPSERDLYPEGFQTTIQAGPLAAQFEGKSRRGHFDGMLTVVAKLFQLVRPHFAVFGEKDFQQLRVIQRMVRDLHFPVEIVPMPVLRDSDGLAMSSRNVRLSDAERKRALCLFHAISATQERAFSGERNTNKLLSTARACIRGVPGVRLDYAAIVDARSLERIRTITGPARLLLAAEVGRKKVRLLDNGPLFVRAP